jgi:hypothetical protein
MQMTAEVYDALKEAGASEEKARAAASVVASYNKGIAEVKAGLMPIKWMICINLALALALVWKVFG